MGKAKLSSGGTGYDGKVFSWGDLIGWIKKKFSKKK